MELEITDRTRLEAFRALVGSGVGEPGTVISYRIPQCAYCGRKGPRASDGTCLGCGATKAA